MPGSSGLRPGAIRRAGLLFDSVPLPARTLLAAPHFCQPFESFRLVAKKPRGPVGEFLEVRDRFADKVVDRLGVAGVDSALNRQVDGLV